MFAIVLPAVCQESDGASGGSSFGVVVYAEGETVYIIRDQRRQVYDAFTGELLGFPVYPGDMIQTDPDTYVEIQLLPSGSIIKVAENTSFTLEQVGPEGQGVLELAYGRLRARVDRMTGGNPFQIRGSGAVAGVRGTDFGTDVIADATQLSSLTRVYCFEGEIEVDLVMTAEPPGEPPSPIVIAANQMLVASAPGPDETVATAQPEVTAIDDNTQIYWQERDFVAEPEEAAALLARFPDLETKATERLGPVEFLDAVPEPSATPEEPSPDPGTESESQEPGVAAKSAEQIPEASEAVSIEAGGMEVDPERRQRLISATRITGVSMVALGALADATAATFYFFGDQILPSWPPASDKTVILTVGASGAALVFTGLLTLFFSAVMGQ